MQDPEQLPQQTSEYLPPIPSPTGQAAKPLLECPYCRFRFPLTWARYWKTAFLVLQCPHCRKISRIKQPWWTYLVTFPVMFISMVPGVFFALRAITSAEGRPMGSFTGFLTGIAVAFLVGIPVVFLVDKAFSERFSYLVKRKEKKREP